MTRTKAQTEAIHWLNKRGGSCVVNRHGRVLAGGEVAYFAPETWLRLVAMGDLSGMDGRLYLTPHAMVLIPQP